MISPSSFMHMLNRSGESTKSVASHIVDTKSGFSHFQSMPTGNSLREGKRSNTMLSHPLPTFEANPKGYHGQWYWKPPSGQVEQRWICYTHPAPTRDYPEARPNAIFFPYLGLKGFRQSSGNSSLILIVTLRPSEGSKSGNFLDTLPPTRRSSECLHSYLVILNHRVNKGVTFLA